MNDIFCPYFCSFLQVDFIAYTTDAMTKLAVSFDLLFVFMFVLYVTLGKTLWTVPWFLVESYTGFHVETKPWEHWESGLCATDWECQKCITKCGNSSCKSLYFSMESIQASHASEEQELAMWCVTQSRSPENVAPLVIKKWDSRFPHLYSLAVDCRHRHTTCIERLSFGFQYKHALWCKW